MPRGIPQCTESFIHSTERFTAKKAFPGTWSIGNSTSESGAMESAEGAWPTKGNASRSKALFTHLIRRHLLHSLQGKQGPKVDAGARKGMLRVIGGAANFGASFRNRTVTKDGRRSYGRPR
jgi:hypothetical protein